MDSEREELRSRGDQVVSCLAVLGEISEKHTRRAWGKRQSCKLVS